MLSGLLTSSLSLTLTPPAVVVSTASPRAKHNDSSLPKDILDDDYGDPNIDFDTEYLGASYLPAVSFPPPHPALPEDESPYPEVRSAVANTDDPDMPAGTLRAWMLGLLWAIIIPGVNQFFFFRFPNVTVGPVRPCPLFCPTPAHASRHSLSPNSLLSPSDG